MIHRPFNQIENGKILTIYLNSEDKVYLELRPDNDDVDLYEFQCTTLDLDDALELYNELGKLIAEMKVNG